MQRLVSSIFQCVSGRRKDSSAPRGVPVETVPDGVEACPEGNACDTSEARHATDNGHASNTPLDQMISDACRSCVIPRLSTRTRDINQVYFCHRNKLACTNLHGKRLTEVSLTRCAFCSKKLYSIAEWPWCNICTVLPCNVSYFFHQPAKHQSIDCCLFIGQIIMSQATACRGQDTPAGMSTVLQTAALSQATGPILETCWYCWYCLLPALSSPHSFHGTHSSHIHIGETVRGEAGIPTDSYSPCHWLVRVNPWPTCLLLASWHEKIGDPNGVQMDPTCPG